ncbi:hypothetical protein LBMAG38_15940 [Chloroflexota bacterium]|nr:hypothetical protein LBMAG38_15940 [Chloroflexota bacterium]
MDGNAIADASPVPLNGWGQGRPIARHYFVIDWNIDAKGRQVCPEL